MIIIGGDMKIKVEHRADAIAAFVAMQQASQAEEGCITYVFSADLEAEDTIHLFEIWEDTETLAAHGQTAHMAAFREKMANYRISANIGRYSAEPAS
ncbi:MAG: antibiotic biosynthesis monooxygenase [Caldilineaceae bacterium]|nr:antibiotic biosynthesis monooxygenase [Caldilineaceae bacterium]